MVAPASPTSRWRMAMKSDEQEDAELRQPAERVMGEPGGQPLAAGLHFAESRRADRGSHPTSIADHLNQCG